MASANNQFESGESFTKTADSAGNGGIARASAEAYATGATQAANYSDGNAHSCLPQVQLYDSSAGSGGAAADAQTLNDFQGVNESFANLTNQYATAISDLGAGGNSQNAVADLANLYGSMTQSGNQLGNVSYEQGSTYTNDSNLQNQLSDGQKDLSFDEQQVLNALSAAAKGDTAGALNTLLTNFSNHFSTDTQADISSAASLAQSDYNIVSAGNSGGTGGDSGTTTGTTGTTGGDSGTTTGTTGATGGDSGTTTGTTGATGGDSGTTTGTTATTGGDSGTTTGTTGTTATTGGDTGTTTPPSDSSAGSSLPAHLNDALNAQQQAGLAQVNDGKHGLEARAETHVTNAYDQAQTALNMLAGGASTADISRAIHESADNIRDARNSFYTSLTNNGVVRHKYNPDDPINQGLNQYPAANREFKLAQDALSKGDRTAATEAVTAALQAIANGNNSVLGGLGEEQGVA